jgi:hypothetical protein
MACCPSTIYEFVNEAFTTIPYNSGLQAIHGSMPKVLVRYLDPDTGEYVFSSFFTRVAFNAGNIIVDHGGSNQSGIISLS